MQGVYHYQEVCEQKGGEVSGTVDILNPFAELAGYRQKEPNCYRTVGSDRPPDPPFLHRCPIQSLGMAEMSMPVCSPTRLFLCVLLACATGKRMENGL